MAEYNIQHFLKSIKWNNHKNVGLLLNYLGSHRYVHHFDEQILPYLKDLMAGKAKIDYESSIWGFTCFRTSYVLIFDREEKSKVSYLQTPDKSALLVDDEGNPIFDTEYIATHCEKFLKIPIEEFYQICVAWRDHLSTYKPESN